MAEEAILSIGKVIKDSIRLSDFLFRYSSEGFAVILPSTESEQALGLCKRIRDSVAQTQLEKLAGQGISTSICLSHYSQGTSRPATEFVQKMEAALYESMEKSTGHVLELNL